MHAAKNPNKKKNGKIKQLEFIHGFEAENEKNNTIALVHIKKVDECIKLSIFTVKHPTVLVMKSSNNNSGYEREPCILVYRSTYTDISRATYTFTTHICRIARFQYSGKVAPRQMPFAANSIDIIVAWFQCAFSPVMHTKIIFNWRHNFNSIHQMCKSISNDEHTNYSTEIILFILHNFFFFSV